MKKIVLMITVALKLVGMIPTLAAAQNYDIKEMTPAENPFQQEQAADTSGG